MSPSHHTVLSRRHLVLVVLRVAAAGLMAYGVYRAVKLAVVLCVVIPTGGVKWSWTYVFDIVDPVLSLVVSGLVLAAASHRLARWIVPPGLRGDECPQCGYSLRRLKSPICPECGADVRAVTREGGA